MRILTDFHHPDLYESLLLTFEDRLGWEVFRVIGKEWYEQGYWGYEVPYAGPRYVDQFLSIRDTDESQDGYLTRVDLRHPGRTMKMVTIQQALDMGFDIVLSTVPEDEPGFKRMADRLNAKFAIQIGNNEHTDRTHWAFKPLILISTTGVVPFKLPHVRHDQEVDVKMFPESPVPVDGQVASFMNVWYNWGNTFGLYQHVMESIPERKFKVFGDKGVYLETLPEVAEEMRKCAAIWHTKEVGDGWGHTIHTACLAGRPIIGIKAFYNGHVGERLWQDNSLDITGNAFEKTVEQVRELLNNPDRLVEMGRRSREIFLQYVDYDRDAKAIGELLS